MRNSLTTRLSLWLPVAIWMGIIFFLSSRPDLPMPEDDLLSRIVSSAGHAGVFGMLMVLLLRAIAGGFRWVLPKQALLSFALTMAYALFDEFHQAFVPNRMPDIVDLIVDAVGAGIAFLGWQPLTQTISQRERAFRASSSSAAIDKTD